MNRPLLSVLISTFAVVLIHPADGHSPPVQDQGHAQRPDRKADADGVKELLALYETAKATGLSARVREALEAMMDYHNEEFVEPALECLDYRHTREDKKAIVEIARENRVATKERVASMLEQDENKVRITAARLLANFPSDKNAKQLLKRVGSRRLKDREDLAGAFVEALGWMEHRKSEPEVFRLYKKSGKKHILRGCVRYFRLIDTSRFDVARELAMKLDPPERPRNNDRQSERNVSAFTLYRHQMDIFNFIKNDISKTIETLTGRWFPATDQGALDAQKFIRDNRRRLGLR